MKTLQKLHWLIENIFPKRVQTRSREIQCKQMLFLGITILHGHIENSHRAGLFLKQFIKEGSSINIKGCGNAQINIVLLLPYV